MRKILTTVAATAAAVTATALPAQATTHPAPTPSAPHTNMTRSPDPRTFTYVAIGDSYSTGVGAGDSSGRCRRSPHSFPNLLGATSNLSCWGNTIGQAQSGQVRHIPRDADAVTITGGGNNLNFVGTSAKCMAGYNVLCGRSLTNAFNLLAKREPYGAMNSLIRAVHRQAPHAKVYVIGYPHLMQGRNCRGTRFSADTMRAFNRATDILDSELQSSARANHATFIDMRGVFSGHAMCSAHPYINSVDFSDPSGTLHPTRDGYAVEAQTLAHVIYGF